MWHTILRALLVVIVVSVGFSLGFVLFAVLRDQARRLRWYLRNRSSERALRRFLRELDHRL